MKSWTVVFCLVVSQLAELGCGKRVDPAMMDPLMRRSMLDRNFLRFGRSSPSFTEKDEVDENLESLPETDTNKEDSFLRSMRGKDNNFMRFGRGRNENFMRFGRGKQDSFMRFGRARNDNFMRFGRGRDNNFMRFGRGKQDNFMRFGRGKEDNYMRFGRGKGDNYMRFGRGKEDNYMRFGRGKEDNYMRFGRGKEDNYMRFGRGKEDNYMRFGRGKEDNYMRFGRGKQDNFMRFGRGKQDNFMRFGRANYGKQDSFMRLGKGKQDSFMRFGKDFVMSDNPPTETISESAEGNTRGEQDNRITFGNKDEEDDTSDVPIAMRSVNSNQNFIRFGRGKQENFMRFGKSDKEKDSLQIIEDLEENKDIINDSLISLPSSVDDDFSRETKSKDLNLIRLGRHPVNANNAFIRFGKRSHNQIEENSQDNEIIPQRLKRSVASGYESPGDIYSSEYRQDGNDRGSVPFTAIPEDLETESGMPLHQDDFSNRKKRSLIHHTSAPPPVSDDSSIVDYISAKLRLGSSYKPEYGAFLLSAGLPNVIVGPEFSFLPDLDPPASMLKRDQAGAENFLRLGG